MIGIKRHSLDQRLEWVDAHYAAHPEFVAHSIYSMFGDVVLRTRGESAVMKAKVARLLALPLLYTNQLNEERMAMYAKR